MKWLDRQQGFTLLELLVVTAVIGVLAVVVSDFYVDRLIDYARTNTLIILQSNTKQALENLERDVRSAQTIESANLWPDTNGPGGNPHGWSSTSGTPSTLVLAVPTEDSNGNLQYVDTQHNAIQTNDIIYYVASGTKTLYRRVIVNPVCSINQGGTGVVNCNAQSTCPPGSTTPTCPADGKVIEDVANLAVSYYDNSNTPTNNVANAYSLAATLTQSRTQYAHTFTNSLTSRVSLRNKP